MLLHLLDVFSCFPKKCNFWQFSTSESENYGEIFSQVFRWPGKNRFFWQNIHLWSTQPPLKSHPHLLIRSWATPPPCRWWVFAPPPQPRRMDVAIFWRAQEPAKEAFAFSHWPRRQCPHDEIYWAKVSSLGFYYDLREIRLLVREPSPGCGKMIGLYHLLEQVHVKET